MSTLTEITVDELPITLDLPPIMTGSDYEFSIQMLDDNEDAQDTTSWTMTIMGRAGGANGELLFTLTSSPSAGITMTAGTGSFVVKIADAITTTIKVSKVYWDCKVVDASSDVTFPFRGVLDIIQAVTR
jgi:hypothetical protein